MKKLIVALVAILLLSGLLLCLSVYLCSNFFTVTLTGGNYSLSLDRYNSPVYPYGNELSLNHHADWGRFSLQFYGKWFTNLYAEFGIAYAPYEKPAFWRYYIIHSQFPKIDLDCGTVQC